MQNSRHVNTRLGYALDNAGVGRVYAGVAHREARWAVAGRYLHEALAVRMGDHSMRRCLCPTLA